MIKPPAKMDPFTVRVIQACIGQGLHFVLHSLNNASLLPELMVFGKFYEKSIRIPLKQLINLSGLNDISMNLTLNHPIPGNLATKMNRHKGWKFLFLGLLHWIVNLRTI